MTIVDVDDLYEGHDRLDLLVRLRQANPAFRCTVFAIPARCSAAYLASLPEWIELVPHGWEHGDPPTDGGECRAWDYPRMRELMRQLRSPKYARFVSGFKAPGWRISDDCYDALLEAGWWVADEHLQDARRPAGLLTYLHEDAADRHHFHVQNVCGNGLEERFDELLALVEAADSFQFASEAVIAWA